MQQAIDVRSSQRLSHDKQTGEITFDEFSSSVAKLTALLDPSEQRRTCEVLTAEDPDGHFMATCTYVTEELESTPDPRKSYPLEELSSSIWDRSSHVSVFIKFPDSDAPAMIVLSVDKQSEPDRLMYYWQALSPEIAGTLRDSLTQQTSGFDLGDGFSRPGTAPTVPSLSLVSAPTREGSAIRRWLNF